MFLFEVLNDHFYLLNYLFIILIILFNVHMIKYY
jgi:hypothetical protein